MHRQTDRRTYGQTDAHTHRRTDKPHIVDHSQCSAAIVLQVPITMETRHRVKTAKQQNMIATQSLHR